MNLSAGSTLTFAGNLTNTVNTTGSNLGSGAAASILLDSSTLTVGGTLTNSLFGNPGGSGSAAAMLSLSDNSTVNVTGLVDNTDGLMVRQGGGNVLTGARFINTNGTLSIGSGDTADFRIGGALGGSTTFDVGGTFLFDPTSGMAGGNINVIGAGTTLGLPPRAPRSFMGPARARTPWRNSRKSPVP